MADLVVDLAASDAQRLPQSTDLVTRIAGVALARLPVAPDADPRLLLQAFLATGGVFPAVSQC
jgi:hypothetical protein